MNVPFSIVGPGILVIESDRLVQTDEYKRQVAALGKIKADIFRPAPTNETQEVAGLKKAKWYRKRNQANRGLNRERVQKMRYMRSVTDLGALMRLAKELGDARKSGDESRIAEAQKAHDEYRDLCLQADEMQTGYTYGSLNDA